MIGRDDPATPSTGPPELRVGHKGLFFDRLDGGIADPLTGFDLPRLWPGARLSGHVRNRTLHCDFGRWNQPDPNATGLPVQASLSYHGGGLSASVQGYELQGHFGDGANVYAYLKSGPFRQSDPLGLFSTPELALSTSFGAGIQHTTATAIAGIAGSTGGGSILQGFLATLLSSQSNTAVLAIGAGIALERIAREDEGDGRYVVRIQAQGGKERLEAHLPPIVSDRPITVAQGLAGLAALRSMLTSRQLKEREECFRKAEAYIKKGPPFGVPSGNQSFINRKLPGGVRVDVVTVGIGNFAK